MTAPYNFRTQSRNEVVGLEFRVNDDPGRLDVAYADLFGSGSDQLLCEETKWLAVTHKSFDHGRRGFNDRLAFLGEYHALTSRTESLGKRIVTLQATLDAVHQLPIRPSPLPPHSSGREPVGGAASAGLDNLAYRPTSQLLDMRLVSQLARHRGLAHVVRWKPKNVCIVASIHGPQ